MKQLFQDLVYATRMLRKRPWATTVAVLTLALGIGANTAIFSVISGIFLEPMPFPEAERIVALERGYPQGRGPSVSEHKYFYWRQQSSSFRHVAVYDSLGSGFNLIGDGRPERIAGSRVSHEFFDVLGIRPALGRTFQATEDLPGGPLTVILSDALWKRRFGADTGILDQSIVLNNRSYQVVGIMPPGLEYPEGVELWTPLQLNPNSEESGHYLLCAARLEDGVTLEQARAELDVIGQRFIHEVLGETESRESVALTPLVEQLYGELRTPFLVLMGVVVLVLLLACVNVANLQLARAAARRREIAIRTTLGATSSRITRQMLTESLLLALLGGGGGLVLCALSLQPLLALSPQPIPRADQIGLDPRVLLFTLVIALVTGLLFGLAPALQTRKLDLNETVKEASTGSGVGGGKRSGRGRMALVVAEIALALLPMLGAGLLIKSFLGLRNTDPGFETASAVRMALSLSEKDYAHPRALDQLQRELIPQLEALPGVDSATLAVALPNQIGMDLPFSIDGRDGDDAVVGGPQYRPVSPHYLEAMGIELLQGRPFDFRDGADAPPVALINQQLADLAWPEGDAIGARIRIGAGMGNTQMGDTKGREIVGIVSDVRETGLQRPVPPVLYVPLPQMSERLTAMAISMLPMQLAVRGQGALMPLARSVQEEIWVYDPDQPVTDIQTLDALVSDSIGNEQFHMTLLGILAGLALLLAGVGIYSVLAYLVGQRTREIGIRMALGASTRRVSQMVLRQGLWAVALGLALGLGGAIVATRVLASLVVGVSTTDPLIFSGVSLVLLVIALLAMILPARRASKVDPLVALRFE